MRTEYYLLTVDVAVQGPVTLTAATQGCRKEHLGPKQNPSQIETGFDIVQGGGKKVWQKKRKVFSDDLSMVSQRQEIILCPAWTVFSMDFQRLMSPSKSSRKLACVPVVPFEPRSLAFES